MFALHITSPVRITYIKLTATIIEISIVMLFERVETNDAILPSPSGSIIPAISLSASIKITSCMIGAKIVPTSSSSPQAPTAFLIRLEEARMI